MTLGRRCRAVEQAVALVHLDGDRGVLCAGDVIMWAEIVPVTADCGTDVAGARSPVVPLRRGCGRVLWRASIVNLMFALYWANGGY
jgi:hypothetical protein